MLLFGKRQYTKLPTLLFQHMLIDRHEALDKKSESLQRTFENFDNRAVQQTELALGDKVIIQDPISKLWVAKGEISQLLDDGLSYLIITEDGQELQRGLKLARKLESPRFSPPSRTQSNTEKQKLKLAGQRQLVLLSLRPGLTQLQKNKYKKGSKPQLLHIRLYHLVQ